MSSRGNSSHLGRGSGMPLRHALRGITYSRGWENSGDFRFVNNSPFSTRYRNNLQLERDCKLRRCCGHVLYGGELTTLNVTLP
jgi:hypothetical protein